MKQGEPTTVSHDAAGYFDLSPVDLGEVVRRVIVLALEAMGFHVEAAHHEVAPGQHEIDFRYDDVLTTAAHDYGLMFSIRRAQIDHRTGGFTVLDLTGPADKIEAALHGLADLVEEMPVERVERPNDTEVAR